MTSVCVILIFSYLCALKIKTMRHIRKYSALVLLVLFSCYYSGISMFSHVHIVNGTSLVHSHLGGGSEHNHSDSQYAVIDILSNFQSEGVVECYSAETSFFLLSENLIGYLSPLFLMEEYAALSLRGPPQA